jgi:nucleoside-diphosphate-sugar epimerase
LILSSALVIGCGYLGESLLRALSEQGWQAVGLTLSDDSAAKLRSSGLNVLACDVREPDFAENLQVKAFSLVVHCASSGRGGTDSYQTLFLGGTRNLFAALEAGHVLFVSSTSVYAQADGSLVNEISPAEPERMTGKILRSTEDLVLGQGGTVARLAGLYGPGRCLPLARLLAGDAIIEGEGERIMNSIYRDDALSGLLLLANLKPGGIFNVVDNRPSSQLEWFRWVAKRLRRPIPPFGPRDLMRKRAWTNKRVSNAKLSQLGWKPGFPSFREGVERILEELGEGVGTVES